MRSLRCAASSPKRRQRSRVIFDDFWRLYTQVDWTVDLGYQKVGKSHPKSDLWRFPALWGDLGRPLGRLWVAFGVSWVPKSRLWASFGLPLGGPWGHLGVFGVPFGFLWGALGGFGAVFWSILGVFFVWVAAKVAPGEVFLGFWGVARPRGCRSRTRRLMFGAYQRFGFRGAFCPLKVSQKVTSWSPFWNLLVTCWRYFSMFWLELFWVVVF